MAHPLMPDVELGTSHRKSRRALQRWLWLTTQVVRWPSLRVIILAAIRMTVTMGRVPAPWMKPSPRRRITFVTELPKAAAGNIWKFTLRGEGVGLASRFTLGRRPEGVCQVVRGSQVCAAVTRARRRC